MTAKLLLAATRAEPIERRLIRRNGANGTFSVWHRAEPGRSYVVVGDTSEGTGGDAGAGHVLERGTGRHMATLHGQFKPHELAAELAAMGKLYGWAVVVVERNNHGHAVLRALDFEQKYPHIFLDRDEKPGWINVEVYRTAALDALEQAHRSGTWRTLDRATLGEFRTFVVSKTGKAEAARGAKDDLVLCAAIGWDVIRRPVATTYRSPRLPSA